MEPVVVVLCGLSRSAGGVFYAGNALCKELVARGASLSVYGRKDSRTEEDAGLWDPVPATAYRTFGPLCSSAELRPLLRRSDPALVHLHGLWMDEQWAALQWQKRTGKPVVISPHGMLDPWAVRNAAWKKKIVGRLFAEESLRKAACIHALCESEMKSIRQYGLRNPIAVIPNGVDLPDPDTSDCRPCASFSRKRMLFLGRIHPKKGLSELISGWAQFKKRNAGAEWQLVIAGWDDGGHPDRLIGRAEAAGLTCSEADIQQGSEADIHLAGPQFGEAKDRLLRSVDAFILPSFSEGLPVSVLEAWAYGLPVVMTEFCNLPEGFSAGAALPVEPDAVSIADGVEHIARMSESERLAMGAKGRDLVQRKFTWSRIAQEMMAVYAWCLGGDRPPYIEDSGTSLS